MADVFISYAREDRARAEQIARGLEALGLDPFWDTDIPPGQTWADYIEGKLGVCKAVVVLWSQHSTKSQWVREEARMGRDKSKLIPAIIDGATPPLGFGEVQAANLSHWNGSTSDPEWTRFASAVHASVRGADAPVPTPPPQIHAPRPAYTPPPSAGAAAPAASPIEYIQKCLKMYGDGKGRARRSEFAWFTFFGYVAMFIGAAIDYSVAGVDYNGASNSVVVLCIAYVALLAPAAAVGARRAHDFGQSGWLGALTVIPYLGFVASLAFAFIPGQVGDNAYGPDPKAI